MYVFIILYMCFNILQGWFDENTRNKIHVLGSLTSPESPSSKEITAIISPSNLPQAYGGELNWEFFDEPILDDEARKVIGEMPKGPWIFEDGKVQRPKEYTGSDMVHIAAPTTDIPPPVLQSEETDVSKPLPNGSVNEVANGDAVISDSAPAEPKE